MSSTSIRARPEEDADDFVSVKSDEDQNQADFGLDEWLDAISAASQGLSLT